MKTSTLSFDDTKIAFGDKSESELRMMHFLFSTMNYPFIADFGIWSTLTALKLGLPVKGLIRKTIFAQFCGGESLEGCKSTIDKLGQSNIKAILDFSAEGEKTEEGFEANMEETLRAIRFAEGSENTPIAVMKLTAFIDFDILVKVQNGQPLNPEEKEKYSRFETRIKTICQQAVTSDRSLYIDAEESWIQGAIDQVAIRMMLTFNKEKTYIFNTYQLYNVHALNNLMTAHQLVAGEGCFFGAKLVRGAYMEKERERAEELGYPDPIQPNKSACDHDYDQALRYCINHLENLSLCAGTHNEQSCALLAELIDDKGLQHNDPRVYFAQLYGMSDNISYKLAHEGYNVAKYVPYGPVAKVMPYLMRRAEENTAMAGQSSREYRMVKKELQRRREVKAGVSV